jgi:RNA polymerase sigma-70 factor, ECF subfamily
MKNEGELQEVVLRAAQGDPAAFSALYECFGDYVRNTAFHILHNSDDTEDVAQNVWRKLLLNLDKYPSEVRFSTWLYRVVCNEAIDHARRSRVGRQVALDALGDDHRNTILHYDSKQDRTSPNQELDFLHTRVREELSNFLNELTLRHPQRARCFAMRYLQDLSINEIAAETEMSVGTVKSHLYYARQYLTEEYPLLFDLYLAVQERLDRNRP